MILVHRFFYHTYCMNFHIQEAQGANSPSRGTIISLEMIEFNLHQGKTTH